MSAHKHYLKHIASVYIHFIVASLLSMSLAHDGPISWNLQQLIKYQPIIGASDDLDSQYGFGCYVP